MSPADATPRRARVVLVGCDPIVAYGLERLFEETLDLDTIEAAATEEDALARIEGVDPDLVVVSDAAPGIRRWYELLAEIRWRWSDLPVMALVRDGSVRDARRAHRLGVHAAVEQGATVEAFREAVSRVLAGDRFIGAGIQQLLASAPETPPSGPLPRLDPPPRPSEATPLPEIDGLSPREIEVLRLIGRGLAPRDIADRLGISARTVHAHRENLKRKLGQPTTSALDQFAVGWALDHERIRR